MARHKVRVMVFGELELSEDEAEQAKEMAEFEQLALKTIEGGVIAKSTKIERPKVALQLRGPGDEL